MLDKFSLPPALTENATKAWDVVRPWALKAMKALQTMATAGRVPTVGDSFKHLCVVGLNKSELLLGGEKAPVFSDTWQDLADDNLKRNMGLVFFAPRTLEGTPVNPYLFLAGEARNGEAVVGDDDGAVALAEQSVQGVGLMDFCRMAPSAPNQLNMVLAADVLFHWDVHDNYVLPTTNLSWVRDVEQVMKGYPRTTKAVLYTSWETDLLPPTDRITVKPLRDLPLHEDVWLNKPTFQDQYGTHVLVLGLAVAAGMWFLTYTQGREIDAVNEQLRVVEQQIPNQGRGADLARAVTEQEKFLQKRDLFYLAVKDTARAIEGSKLRFENFEIRQPDLQTPPKELVVTVEAQKGAYEGWLQEEPIAKDFLMNSAMMVAIRKPPANAFKMEALIPMDDLWREYRKLVKVTPAKEQTKPETAAEAGT